MSVMKKILVILGHPSEKSFNGTIFKHYIKQARLAGHQVRSLSLGKLSFDLISRQNKTKPQLLEPDLQKAQKAILWAEHLVFIYPIWWGNLPALLKGFIDRVFISGFSHRYLGKRRYVKLLTGKSAELIVTMDAPGFFEKFLLCAAATRRVMQQAVLEFCGIRPVKITRFAQLRTKNAQQRVAILDQISRQIKKLR